MKRIIVIGAGASGMLAAIAAARRGASVTVLEGMEKPGRKLLLTGSGRCNLTNLHQEENCYHGADSAWTGQVLSQFPVERTLRFFQELGLLTCERGGYVYPLTGQASSVLDVLLLEMRRRGVKLKCREKVASIRKEDGRFAVSTDSWTYEADAVILAAGSAAAPGTGSDGSGYRLAAQCGHSIREPLPALVPLKVRENWIRRLAGVRMPAAIAIRCGGDAGAHTECGELQWTDYGISGIAVFQLSRYAVRALTEHRTVTASVNLLPGLSEEELSARLCQKDDGLSAAEMLAGMLPPKAIAPVLEYAGIRPSARAGELPGSVRKDLAHAMLHVRLTISGFRSLEQAQVCQGGADCREISPKTLESCRMPGLYLTGELLDVDGICGGYNLQWAWASGFVAGSHAAGTGQRETAEAKCGADR